MFARSCSLTTSAVVGPSAGPAFGRQSLPPKPRCPVGVGSRRGVTTKIRKKFQMDKHRFIKNIKKVRYVSAIPQFTGPLGRQTKKRPCVKDYRKMPRLRQFKRER
eukprot:gnl/TRDRNA2_/TRDRNA2_127694_c0_seq2.p1 gnl/TRDRNA2_/TRDRNA2_127694_c0~~gnl/TRDRNA2_/TRDRNA2_127694_c0_seq2.p1  ORF type:complete len:105 (+),score=7.74 gnl/TRDRNA2_/TRDRNA2_127694_c0_seq2:177-491(+)